MFKNRRRRKKFQSFTLSFCSRSFAQPRSRSRTLARGDGGSRSRSRARSQARRRRGRDRQSDRQHHRRSLQRSHVLDDDDTTEGYQRDRLLAPSSQLGIVLCTFPRVPCSTRLYPLRQEIRRVEMISLEDLDGSRMPLRRETERDIPHLFSLSILDFETKQGGKRKYGAEEEIGLMDPFTRADHLRDRS